MTGPRTKRRWLLLGAVAVAVPVTVVVVKLVWFLVMYLPKGSVGETVCFYNTRSEAVALSVNDADVGTVAAGRSLCKSVVPGAHRLVARGKEGVAEKGDFVVPPKKGPLSSFVGVFVLGDQPRLVVVERCYGACDRLPLNVMRFSPPGKFFPVPPTVYAPLDEPFPERDIVKGRNKIRAHLCSLSAAGQPQCDVR